MSSKALLVRVRRASLLRVIYAICLLGGMSTHVATLWQHGLFWDYGGVPLLTRVYWTLLTFLDPLAAILLFVYPRVGLFATLAIISTDVAHNLWFCAHYHTPLNWMIASQCTFLVFVLVSFPSVWRGFDAAPVTG
jgi:hypothetical protein